MYGDRANGQTATQSTTIAIAAAPVIARCPAQRSRRGRLYKLPFTVAGGTSPFIWSVSTGTLPAGMSLDPSTGILSGTSNVSGLSSFTVRVQDAQGASDSKAVTLRVALHLAISGTPPAGEVGASYAFTYSLTGGTAPFTWSVSVGTLPAGLFLNTTTGQVTGVPTTAGSKSFTVHVVDSQSQAGNLASSINIVASPSLTNPPPPGGAVSVPYSTTLTVTGGVGPFSWVVDSGNLPNGLSLGASSGIISGTPTVAGTFGFDVLVTDANGQTADEFVAISITAAPSIDSGVPGQGELGAEYRFFFSAAGGTEPFVWSVSAGVLPPGLTLDADGTLGGVPSALGTSSFTVKVVDANGVSDTQAISFVVVDAPSIGGTPPPPGEVGVAYSTTYTVIAGTGPFAWSISAGALPAGLSLDSGTGRVSGVPTAAGTSTFTLRVADAQDLVATLDSAITIVPVVALSYPDTHGLQGSALRSTRSSPGGPLRSRSP